MIYSKQWVETGDKWVNDEPIWRITLEIQAANLAGVRSQDLIGKLDYEKIIRHEGFVLTANGSTFTIPGALAPSVNLTYSDGIIGACNLDWSEWEVLNFTTKGPAGTGSGTIYLTVWTTEGPID